MTKFDGFNKPSLPKTPLNKTFMNKKHKNRLSYSIGKRKHGKLRELQINVKKPDFFASPCNNKKLTEFKKPFKPMKSFIRKLIKNRKIGAKNKTIKPNKRKGKANKRFGLTKGDKKSMSDLKF
eukprot:UN34698